MNGYNFTERVRKVLAMAREESARLHHEYVGTEHILLGLIREGEGVAVSVLQRLNVDLAGLRESVEKAVKPGRTGSYIGPDLPYTSRAKQVLELCMKHARELGHGYVGTEHVLLGLAAEGRGIAAQVLSAAGVDLERAKAETLKIIGAEEPAQWLSPYPSISYETLAAHRGRPIDRVEVILHYTDGGRFEASFNSSAEAQGFLAWATPPGRN
jgi:ATP-dependent Clp protease ATP-binding subunit ClpC